MLVNPCLCPCCFLGSFPALGYDVARPQAKMSTTTRYEANTVRYQEKNRRAVDFVTPCTTANWLPRRQTREIPGPGAWCEAANQACQATVVNSIPAIVQWASQLIIGREKIYTGELHIV
ncbi:hypothetical protein BJ166DRAFT_503265 [Pestalotiopsis sp. NC0098]|nr:hypothetical protein BJ166DRAFT_503265 [Pestalotiopsis sp. NC0098]